MCCISLANINSNYQIIDLRDPYSYHHSHLKNSINIPVTQMNINQLRKPAVLICYSGKQAKELAQYYHHLGKDCYYLEGGYQSIMNMKNNYF